MSLNNMHTKISDRKSGIELLRIISIFGIIIMHSFSDFYASCQGNTLFIGVFINTIFNSGVTCFMLISGYFGMKFSLKKLISLELTIIFYGMVSYLIQVIVEKSFSVIEFVKCFIPISTGKYWFMTCYMVLYCISFFINKIKDVKKDYFRLLLIICVLLFYLVPSILYFSISNDSGKGIVNMSIVYMIGMYIRKYHDTTVTSKKFCLSLFIFVFLALAINISTTYLYQFIMGKSSGLFIPIARDNSIFILLISCSIFVLFKNMNFNNSFINFVSQSVMGIYMLEGAVRIFFNRYFSLSDYDDFGFFFGVLLIYSFAVILACFVFETIRRGLFLKPQEWISKKISKLVLKIIFKFNLNHLFCIKE